MSFDTIKAAAILCAMQSKTVLVVGDVMLDRFVDGDVTRISPEAPVPVLGQTKMLQMPGGAANVAANLAHLGLAVQLVGVCGEDTAGDSLIAEISGYPAIEFTPIRVTDRPTSVKTRYRAAGQQILRVDDEITTSIDGTAQARLLDITMSLIKLVDLVIISDYGKGALPPNLLRTVIDAARTHDRLVIVDPKLADLSAYAGASLLTPNLAELRNLIDFSSDTLDSIGDAAAILAERHGFDNVLTTLSARGMLLSNANGERFHDPASARDVFDVSGAGDTVIAALGGAMAADADIHDAVRLANHAAGVVVGKSGTATAVAGEILAHMGAATPVTDWQSVARLCFSWREQGQTIAFANGCFDLLHPGHIHLLQEAAAHADHLVVGLNGDRSVRRLKGDSRPVQPADVRSAVLASLDIVDAVALFEEDTPHNLISVLQPDFIVKGGDYRPEDVIGADIVAARGGKVAIVPTLGSHSTSNLIKFSG